VEVGTIVRVRLHGRRVRGWVLELDAVVPDDLDAREIREVEAVSSAGPTAELVDLCRWAAWRWAGPLATFLRAASPANNVGVDVRVERENAVYPGESLTGRALHLIAPTSAVEVPLANAGSTLVIDPSPVRAAALAAGWEREGREVVTLGSEHPDAVRTAQWARARAGACVVVGGRAAVWAPVPDLAAVVVLDDADEALEDERAPTWNARDVAMERAARSDVAVRILTPAPSVDAVVAIGAPVGPAPSRAWPRVEVVDQRDEEPGHGLLSAALADALRHTVARGARAVCVLNRRGRARLLACRTCNELARCEVCGATVAFGDKGGDEGLVCARCATTRPLICLHCHGSTFRPVRPGITRVRDDLAALLPRTEVASVDATTAEIPAVPVLVGTEAVLHRAAAVPGPPVGLVAYLELDQELLAPRARAAEQALWLLVRGARLVDLPSPGGASRLLLQTRLPRHEVVDAARRGDPMLVVAAEVPRRQALGFPPFGGLAEVSGAPEAVVAVCDAVAGDGITVLGPVADGSRALVRAPSAVALANAFATPGVDAARAKGRLRIDVDPRRV
jgi:primosomal protein N' (replication factor Y)